MKHRFQCLRSPACGLLLLSGLPASGSGPYSGGLDDPENEHDAPIPGFVGPHGEGKARLLQSGGTYSNPDNIVNPLFFDWASEVVDYSPAPGLDAQWTDPSKALGPVTGDNFDVVSLGELDQEELDADIPAGSITLGFNAPLRNRSGADFVIFGNAFGDWDWLFSEMAFVEVSTDGDYFARFPSVSLTPDPVGLLGELDPRNVYGLAGKHINAYGESWGTPFDLSWLLNDHPPENSNLDPDNINYIRLVDIPGDGSRTDSEGNPIYDPWPTFGSAGFDLEAVGVISRDMDFATWAAQQISDPGLRGEGDDASGDGLPNLLAYALGRSGVLPEPGPPARPHFDQGRLGLEFNRDERATDLVYEVQVSSDLKVWTAIARSEFGQPFVPVNGFEPHISEESASANASVGVIRAVRVRDVTDSASRRFMRLKVIREGSGS